MGGKWNKLYLCMGQRARAKARGKRGLVWVEIGPKAKGDERKVREREVQKADECPAWQDATRSNGGHAWRGRHDVGCPMGQVGACVLSGRVGGGRRNVCWHGWQRAVQGTRGEVVTRRGETRQLGEGEGEWCGASGRDDVREDSQLEDVGSGSESGGFGGVGSSFPRLLRPHSLHLPGGLENLTLLGQVVITAVTAHISHQC